MVYKQADGGDFLKTGTKAELLRYILLTEKHYYDNMLFEFLSVRYMEKEIEKIDERTFSFDVDAADGLISANQFLTNMNKFVKCMKAYFFNIGPLQTCIGDVIKGGEKELSDLLNYSCTNSCDDDKLHELIYKLIISNFISNAKYILSIKDVLQEIGIPIKRVQDYSIEECSKILTLLSDVALCQRGRGNVMVLFDSMDSRLKYYEAMDQSIRSRKRRRSKDDYKKKYIDSRIVDYDKMFKSYNSKKKYLRYFV